MSFRTRLLIAFALVTLVPLLLFGLGIRREMSGRLTDQYRRRVALLVSIIEEDLGQQSAAIAERLSALEESLTADNRFRLAVVEGAESPRSYLLDYAGRAMRVTGLSMLQIQDGTGRILSSGHFRNEYDRMEPELARTLAATPGAMALVQARTPAGPFPALARVHSFALGGRALSVVGGVAVDRDFLARLARDQDLVVLLEYEGATLTSLPDSPPHTAAGADRAGSNETRRTASIRAEVVGDVALPYVEAAGAGEARVGAARIVVAHPLGPLQELQRRLSRWLLAAIAATGLLALFVAAWLSARVSRPLSELAHNTARIDLDRLDVEFRSDRRDEIGALTRLLGAMTTRLRAGAARLREMERRAAIGDLARQVNHDIRNGLVPIRNVFRHLVQVAREEPQRLPGVLAERQGTVDSSIAYLENLAKNYARLSPRVERAPLDVNAIARQVLRDAATAEHVEMRAELADPLPAVLADPIEVRRILENLLANAVQSLEGRPGRVTLTTQAIPGEARAATVRISVADTGRGMSREEAARAFDDFYTTRAGGTGLGLPIVRRLVLDLGGAIHVDAEPGKGTRFVVELPAASGARAAGPGADAAIGVHAGAGP